MPRYLKIGLPPHAKHSLLVVLAYVALAVAMLGANPFKGEIVGPFDLLARHSGWAIDQGATEVRHPERSDVLDWLLPNWTQAREQLRDGIVPLWNPLQAAGQGLLFDPTKGLVSLAFLLFLLAPTPALGFYAGVLSSLVVAGVGMHFLVSRHCRQIPAFFAGISYMMCGFITAWLFWPHTLSAIWIPWLLLAIDCCVAKPTWRNVAGIGFSTAMMFLGGFPFVVALGLGAALVHVLVSAAATGNRRAAFGGTGAAFAGIALGLALCAIPILALLASLDHIDVGYRSGGSAFGLEDAKLLSRPWAMQPESLRVERQMYVGMAALVLSAIGVFWFFVGKGSALAVSALVYITVGFCLTFGVLPREIGTQLPVLADNPWSRAILLLDIGIILLAATGLDRLLNRFGRGRLVLLFGLAICGAQYFDLLQPFRKFNGPTPDSFYYRAEEHVQQLGESIPPFQYVVQDASHLMVSGTLASIGLGDWFGHSLRAPGHRALLAQLAENPFASPTATATTLRGFMLDSPKMDATASCYFVYPSTGERFDALIRPSAEAERFALPPFGGDVLVQEVAIAEPTVLNAFSVRFATYRETDLDGQVEVLLVDLGDGADIARSIVPASRIVDNNMLTFGFAGRPELAPGRYAFKIAYRPGPAAKSLTAWAYRGEPGLVRGGQPLDAAVDYVVYGRPVGQPPGVYEVVADGAVTAIARNTGCPSGPYWAADLDEPTAAMDDRIVKVEDYAPHHFVLSVETPAAGYLVIPMNYQPGWRAWVNGRRRDLELVYDVMPAVRVAMGESFVVMRYAPPHWKLGAAISAGALLLFGGVFAFSRVRLRRRKAAAA